jgi:hypothetical protein
MRLEARLRKLEQKAGTGLGREICFPGWSWDDAEREAQAMIERGELAADDMVLVHEKAPFGAPWIRELPCTNAEYRAWLDTLA